MNESSNLPADVVSAIHAGRKIEAIKLLREARGLGLKDAKHAVDAYIRDNPSAQQPRSSGSGLVIIVVLILLGALAFLSGCETESQEPSAAAKALDDLQAKYDELVKDKVDVPVDWAAEDLENIGDWEYRVENIPYSSPEDFAAQLNVFGNERWEVIWLERTPDGFLAVLKKPSVSYLSKVPLSEIGKYVIGISDGQE